MTRASGAFAELSVHDLTSGELVSSGRDSVPPEATDRSFQARANLL
jgi:hypothetical protein